MSLSPLNCPLTYHNQKIVLRWLPVDIRGRLAKAVPSIRSVERRLPYRFHRLRFWFCDKLPSRFVHLHFDDYRFSLVDIGDEKTKLELTVGDSRLKPADLSVNLEVPIVEVARQLVEFFVDRGETLVERLIISHVADENLRNLRGFPVKTSEICIYEAMSGQSDRRHQNEVLQRAMRIETLLLVIKMELNMQLIRSILNIMSESKTRIGFEVGVPCHRFPHKVFERILLKLQDLNPKRGILNGEPEALSQRCVIFELEHADVSIAFRKFFKPARQRRVRGMWKITLVLFVVEKGSRAEHDSDDWQSVFRCEEQQFLEAHNIYLYL